MKALEPRQRPCQRAEATPDADTVEVCSIDLGPESDSWR
jgi:hypothetical protein